MARDGRLVDDHQVDLALQLCRESIAYLERQLGFSALRPPGGKALIRRLGALHDRLEQLEDVLAAIAPAAHSPDRIEPD